VERRRVPPVHCEEYRPDRERALASPDGDVSGFADRPPRRHHGGLHERPKEGNPGMTNPEDFQWPLPVGLSDNDVKKVYVGLVVRAAAFKESTVDKPTDYMAALARADVSWIEEELDRRGVPRGTFDDIEPEDFGIFG